MAARSSGSARRTSTARRASLSRRSLGDASLFAAALITRTLEELVEDLPAERVVDVGCGESPYRDLFGEAVVIGLDFSPAPVSRVARADVQHLPVAEGVADVVLCSEVIEHVPDDRLLAAELARVAAPGGSVVLTAPFVHSPHELPHDYRRPTAPGLVHVLESAGLEVRRVVALGGTGLVLVDLFFRRLHTLLRAVERRGGGLLTRPVRWALPRAQLAAAEIAARPGGPVPQRVEPGRPRPLLTLGYAVVADAPGRSERSPR